MRAPISWAVFLPFLIAVPLLSQPVASPAGALREPISSESLLQRAHAMLPGLTLSDRLSVLSRLADNGRKHREDAAVWVDEGFGLAARLPDRNRRVYSQTQLLYPLSGLDVKAALEKLMAMEAPLHPTEDDPRDAAATWVFGTFYREHPGEVDTIGAVARHIGDTGLYPFGGVSNVVSELAVHNFNATTNPPGPERLEAARALVQDAVRYFHESAPSNYGNEQFTYFIREYAFLLPSDSLKAVLQRLVGRLLEPPPPPGDRLITLVPDRDAGSSLIIRNRNVVLLSQLMPLIRSMDPAWERTLRQSPELDRLADKLGNNGSGVGVLGAYTASGREEAALQQLQATAAHMLAKKPEAATKALNQISDPAESASAAATLALDTKDSYPEDSARFMAQAQQGLGKIKTPQDRLKVLMQLARALAAVKQTEQLGDVLDQGFAAVDEIQSALGPGHWDSQFAGQRLAGIVQSAAGAIPEHTLLKIDGVRSPALQANLLIAMARGLDTDEPQTKPPAAPKVAESKR
jgi:hypothetical protein